MPKIVAFLLGLGALLVVGPSPAHAQRVSLGGIDAKLDQILSGGAPVSGHVMLTAFSDAASFCSQDRGYRRVLPDGSLDSEEFLVPEGSTLILTDVSWRARPSPTSFTVGRTLSFRLLSVSPDGSSGASVYLSPPLSITPDNQTGRPGANETLVAGVAIGPGRHVCASVSSLSTSGFALNTLDESVLRGFLVPTP